ncbi:hypothetical protein E2C01_011377 [Portunus trituberculatus]|uniref:Uncharacterized protein n=1 Tax=Portunus trituberculatus TaxID=210409 RepID=A0A5B7DAX9_PORTR|nr:hypothetical protein [Portunus trituberculatus]
MYLPMCGELHDACYRVPSHDVMGYLSTHWPKPPSLDETQSLSEGFPTFITVISLGGSGVQDCCVLVQLAHTEEHFFTLLTAKHSCSSVGQLVLDKPAVAAILGDLWEIVGEHQIK